MLDQWRDEHPVTDVSGHGVAAVRVALADMGTGDRGVPLEGFDRRFRQRHGLLQLDVQRVADGMRSLGSLRSSDDVAWRRADAVKVIDCVLSLNRKAVLGLGYGV